MIGVEFSAVLARARAGDDEAFAVIYRDLAPAIRGFARGRGAKDPDDVVSETMVSTVSSLDRFTGDESAFRAWIFTIAFRRVSDEFRRAGRRVTTESLDVVHEPRGGPSAEDLALDGLAGSPVGAALAQLSQAQRDVLLLRVVADLSVRDVSRILGKRESAVKMIQQRGLVRLQEILATEVSSRVSVNDGDSR